MSLRFVKQAQFQMLCCLRDASLGFYMKQRFQRQVSLLLWVQASFRMTLAGRAARHEELMKQFEAEKHKMLAVLMRPPARKRSLSMKRSSVNARARAGAGEANALKMKEPASSLEPEPIMEELKQRLFALEPQTAAACITSHLDQCNYVYRLRAEAAREEKVRVRRQMTRASQLLLAAARPKDPQMEHQDDRPKCQHVPALRFGTHLAREEYNRLNDSERESRPIPVEPPSNCPIP